MARRANAPNPAPDMLSDQCAATLPTSGRPHAITLVYDLWPTGTHRALRATVSGALDAHTAAHLTDELRSKLVAGGHLVVDLSGVEFADACAAAVLNELDALAAAAAARLHLVTGGRGAVQELCRQLDPRGLPRLHADIAAVRDRIAGVRGGPHTPPPGA